MLGAPGRVFRLIIVKAYRRHDFDDPERRFAHDRAGQLLAGNILFDQHPLAIMPIVARELLRRMRVILAYDENADARALGNGLDDVGPRQQVSLGRLEARCHQSLRNRHLGGAEKGLGEVLLHRHRRRHHAGMAVGDGENLEHAL